MFILVLIVGFGCKYSFVKFITSEMALYVTSTFYKTKEHILLKIQSKAEVLNSNHIVVFLCSKLKAEVDYKQTKVLLCHR